MADTENLDCPFCGGACDPEGWVGSGIGGTPIRGPECEQCGACTDTIEDWNRRATPQSPSAAPEVPPLPDKPRSVYKHPQRGALYDSIAMDAYAIAYACKRAALASRPAEVDDEGLPPLPPASGRIYVQNGYTRASTRPGKGLPLFTAEQYRQGQRDAVAADRARRGDRS